MESIRDIKQNNNRNPHEFHAENIPAALKDQDAWILWHGKWNEKGKLEKTPYAVRGGMAKSTGPETWTTYERAAEAASKRNDVLGLGFVFAPESAFGGVDLDGCHNPETGEIKAWAQEIIDATPTYAEVSPSLTGIKLVGMFKLPPMSGHKKILNEETGEAIEVYDQGRFFTVTGRQIPGTPSEVRNIQIPVEGVLGRYFAKPQRAEKPAYKPQQIRELTDKEQDEATQAIADNLPESHLNDLALDISGYLGRKTHRETVEEIMIAAWDAHGLIKHDGSGLKAIIARAYQRLADRENTTGGPSLAARNPEMYAALEKVFKRPSNGAAKEGSQAQRLVGYAMADASELFLDQNGTEHALIAGVPVPLDRGCYGWLRRLFWEHEEAAATTDLLGTAAGMLRAFAEASGTEHVLHLRAAQHEGAVYLYLRPGRVVRVDSRDWGIDDNPPVMFRRVANLKDLPDPGRGGSLDLLDDFITAQEDRDHRLAKAWLVLALLADVNRPILLAHGPQGATKSSVQRVLKNVIDPGRPESLKLREKDFEQNINKAFIPFFDNVSTITPHMADELSKAVTGAGNAVRKLYADDEDVIREYRRAILLNGLVIPTDKPDLIDRVLPVALRRVVKEERETERHMRALFEDRHPQLLGAVLDALSGALAYHEEIRGLPRLADWAEYAIALYRHLDWGGYDGFTNDWAVIEEGQHATTLEASVLAQAVVKVVNEHGDVTRPPKDMLGLLRDAARSEGLDPDGRENDFPGGVSWLSKRLVPVVPTLEAYQIKVEDGRENSSERKRFIRFYRPGGGNPDGSGQHSDSTGQHPDSIPFGESPIDTPIRTARTARTAFLPENSKHAEERIDKEGVLQDGNNTVRAVRKRRRRRKSAQVSQSAPDSINENAVRNAVRNGGDAVREERAAVQAQPPAKGSACTVHDVPECPPCEEFRERQGRLPKNEQLLQIEEAIKERYGDEACPLHDRLRCLDCSVCRFGVGHYPASEEERIAELTRQGMSADLARAQVRGDTNPLIKGRVVTARKKNGEYIHDFNEYIGHRQTMGGHDLPESPWANPWAPAMNKGLITREEAIEKYLFYVLGDPRLSAEVRWLYGRTLACWCAPEPCHGDVLLALAARARAKKIAQRKREQKQAIYYNDPARYHELRINKKINIRAWVRENVSPRQVTGSHDSYFLKHVVERFLREQGHRDPYVSNADIKGALLEAGYEPVDEDEQHVMSFRIGPKPGSEWAKHPCGPRVLCGPLLIVPRWLPRVRRAA